MVNVVDPFADEDDAAPTTSYLDEVFGLQGVLARRFSGYQPRPGQIALAQAVDRSIADARHLMAEGPTGTGKSIAYAVPAAYHAAHHGRRIVIATANIALQEQLAGKDLPMLQESLPWEFTFALLKGRSNYLCVDRQLEIEAQSCRQRSFDAPARGSQDDEMFQAVKQWARSTKTGDISELDFVPDPGIWRKFSRSSDECKGNKCKSFKNCHAYRAKRAARGAHIIVTNYHMLFAAMLVRRVTSRNVLLPGYDVAILDEAHKAAEIAREFFGFEVTAERCRRVGRQLLKLQDDARAEALERKLRAASAGFFEQLLEYKRKGGYKVRLKTALADDEQIGPYWKHIDDALDQAGYMLRSIAGGTENTDDRADWEKAALRAAEIRCCIEAAMKLDDPDEMVYFLVEDKNAEGNARITLGAKPISVKQKIREELFEGTPRGEPKVKSTYRTEIFDDEEDEPDADERRERGLRDKRAVIVTSATLSVDGKFDYIAEEIGAPEGSYNSLIAESPFNWEKQALLIVPAGLPNPSTHREEHAKITPDVVIRVVQLAEGRTLGLFTSYAALEKTHKALKEAKCPYKLLRQGEMPRTKLVDEFRRDKQSVLLGTESMWAGVDVSGESLSVVVIDKIPFATPDDPVMDAIASRDKKWFFNHSVPRAIIQFKQGFGRLIRSVNDIGVVVLLDCRIIDKSYGKSFLRSLPEVQRSQNLEHIRDFLPPPTPTAPEPVTAAEPEPLPDYSNDYVYDETDDIPF